jgi:TonB family protein
MAGSLTRQTPEIVVPPIQTEIIQEIPRRLMERQPLLAPEMKHLRIEIPPPDIEIDVPIDAPNAIAGVITGASTMESQVKPPPSGPALKVAPRYIIHARVGRDFPNPDAFYPPVSIRREEQGLARVEVCVGPDGALVEEPSVVNTSGSDRLDEAALKLARSGHYLAGSIDGLPIVDCLQLPIRFRVRS